MVLGSKPASLMGVDLYPLVGVSCVVKGCGVVMQSWIRVLIVYNLPHVKDGISLSSSLHAIQLEDTESVPVVVVWGKLV